MKKVLILLCGLAAPFVAAFLLNAPMNTYAGVAGLFALAGALGCICERVTYMSPHPFRSDVIANATVYGLGFLVVLGVCWTMISFPPLMGIIGGLMIAFVISIGFFIMGRAYNAARFVWGMVVGGATAFGVAVAAKTGGSNGAELAQFVATTAGLGLAWAVTLMLVYMFLYDGEQNYDRY